MMNHRVCAKEFCRRGLLALLALLVCFSTAALGANNITGSVRNQSRGEPAAGDEVILLRLDAGMPEETRANTDIQGMFTLHVQYPDKPYLVRAIHQGVSYDQQGTPGQSLSIKVFDAAPEVRGVTGTIEILRTGANGKLLHVSDLIEIENASNPPLTQAGERTFEAYLPANAKIDSVLAAGPGTLAMTISAAPVPGQPGHYSVNFPLRPGATKFGFNYDLPYGGHAAFHTRHAYPLQQMAVMIPPTMKFSSPSSAFEILATGNSRYQVRAANHLQAGEGPQFEISGTGPLQPLDDPSNSKVSSQSPATLNTTQSAAIRSVLSSFPRIDPRFKQSEPPSQSIVLGAVTFVLLAVCALLAWRVRKARSLSAAQTVAQQARQRQRSPAQAEGPRLSSLQRIRQ